VCIMNEKKKLGFGLMRLPKNNEEIDLVQVKEMVDRFLAAGFTYFDTAWAYPGSEDAIRKALVERYPRDSYQLATKNAAWLNCRTRDDAVEQFNTSLARTGAGYFDYYLLHNLGGHHTDYFDDFDMWTFIQDKKQEGLVLNAGFSFHSTPAELEKLLEQHPEVDFVQLQINYADWDNPSVQSRECYETACRFGKPVIIMEPVKGGMLADPPESVKEIFKAAEPGSSCASWALRFAADLEGVLTVLSGMSNIEQMEDNLSYMKDFAGLSAKQQDAIDKARTALKEIPLIPCTHCNYCANVCPENVGIPGTFTALNNLTLYRNPEVAKWQGSWQVGGIGKKSSLSCIKCGQCEEACPQHISIREELEKASELLGDLAVPL